MRAVETRSSVGSSYVDALAYPVSLCVTKPSWRRGLRHGAGQAASASRLMPRCLAVPQSNTVAEVPSGVLIRGSEAGSSALGARRHSGTDPRNSHRARRVALACEVVSEDHITRSKTALGLAVVARIYPYDHAR